LAHCESGGRNATLSSAGLGDASLAGANLRGAHLTHVQRCDTTAVFLLLYNLRLAVAVAATLTGIRSTIRGYDWKAMPCIGYHWVSQGTP